MFRHFLFGAVALGCSPFSLAPLVIIGANAGGIAQKVTLAYLGTCAASLTVALAGAFLTSVIDCISTQWPEDNMAPNLQL